MNMTKQHPNSQRSEGEEEKSVAAICDELDADCGVSDAVGSTLPEVTGAGEGEGGRETSKRRGCEIFGGAAFCCVLLNVSLVDIEPQFRCFHCGCRSPPEDSQK
jgi:hypothetical protein